MKITHLEEGHVVHAHEPEINVVAGDSIVQAPPDLIPEAVCRVRHPLIHEVRVDQDQEVAAEGVVATAIKITVADVLESRLGHGLEVDAGEFLTFLVVVVFILYESSKTGVRYMGNASERLSFQTLEKSTRVLDQ